MFSIDNCLSLYFMDETENHNRIHRLYSFLIGVKKQSLSCLDEDLAYGRYTFVTNVITKISILWMYGNENGKFIGIISTATRILSTICT